MTTLGYILLSTLFISSGSLVGLVTLSIKAEKLQRFLIFLVSLSAGALMGGAFIHLLPEAITKLPADSVFTTVLVSFVSFFLVEKIFHLRHCHKGHSHVHSFGYMNLFGDGIHNFIDGLILAAAFTTDVKIGLATTLAIALHEIPQEIGDFGVLLYAGYNKTKALIANVLVALTVVVGGVAGYYVSFLGDYMAYLLPFAAGGFIYIAASDLMPEIRKETSLKKSLASFGIFLAGILMMFLTAE